MANPPTTYPPPASAFQSTSTPGTGTNTPSYTRPTYPSHQPSTFARTPGVGPPQYGNRLALPQRPGMQSIQRPGQSQQQGQLQTRPKQGKKNLFAKDLYSMMYGFGDDPKPAHDSVLLMEDLVITHILNVLDVAKQVSSNPKRIRVEDIKFAYRHDKKKLERIEELLWMRKEIDKARKVDDFKEFFDEDKEKEKERKNS